MIKNVKLFVNHNDQSIRLGKLVTQNFLKHGFNVTEDSFDLGIAIGGDGAFLRMVKNSSFDSVPYYVGINSGTLGFLQEVNANGVSSLIEALQEEKYTFDEMPIQETQVYHEGTSSNVCSVNEIILRDFDLKTAKFDILIDDSLLEVFTGDGILVSSSVGSTGHNLSYGGSIVYSFMPTLQITPLAPINSVAYKTLRASVIVPEQKEIEVIPTSEEFNLLLTSDGEHETFNKVEGITTAIKNKKIKCLRLSRYNFAEKVNQKLL